MHDPLLDQRLEHCRQLLKLWQNFHLFLGECAKHDRQFSPQEEANFLKVKSQIAILYDSFFESLGDANREMIATAQSIITVVENCILLRQVHRMSPAERKKMEIEWHEAYLLINATIGTLEEEQTKLAAVSHSKHSRDVMIHRMYITTKSVVKDKRLHNALIALVIIAAFVVLPMAGVWNPYLVLAKFQPTQKFYTGGKQFLRSTIMPDLEFETWEEYRNYYPLDKVADGYVMSGVPQAQAVLGPRFEPVTKVLFKGTVAADPKNFKAVHIAEFSGGGHQAFIGFVMFARSSDARSVETRRDQIQSEGVSKGIVELVDVSRVANVLRILLTDSSTEIPKFREKMPK
jgi:hypothetical protein